VLACASHSAAGIVHAYLTGLFRPYGLPIQSGGIHTLGRDTKATPILPGVTIPGQVREAAELEHGAISVLLARRVARAERAHFHVPWRGD
jgi:hypothetical protein